MSNDGGLELTWKISPQLTDQWIFNKAYKAYKNCEQFLIK